MTGMMLSLAGAATFTLSNGETVIGEMLPASANDGGVQIKLGEGEYKRVTWASFSQKDLKEFAGNPKLEPFVTPFIEITQEERMKRTEVPIRQPDRLDLPEKGSFFGAMFSSGLGILLMLLLYGANLYAAYEIAIFRARPLPLVMGLAAVLPVIAPIVFLSLPTQMKAAEEALPAEAGTEAAPGGPTPGMAAPVADEVNPMLDASVAHPTGLKLADTGESAKPSYPPSTTFQRGQFTFNRRFFETKFVGFFGSVRREAEKDMVLVFKTGRATHVATRISRIAANDIHLEVHRGHKAEEVTVPFVEIQEVVLKHKDA